MSWEPRHTQLALDLLRLDTVSPMETGVASALADAQLLYAGAAEREGFRVLLHEPAAPPDPSAAFVPRSVLEQAARLGDEFYRCQPNLVLAQGHAPRAGAKVMLNFHMDTVGPTLTTSLDGDVLRGRGAIDAKGLGVALLAGAAHAFRSDRRVREGVEVLIQSVSGEEGGAMGVYGTRALVERGYVGRLNVVAEPTRSSYLDHTTCSMTARIVVTGEGSTDDEPERGHNATLLLSSLCTTLCESLEADVTRLGAKLCCAGLHTGSLHNRVYGSGSLLLNLQYGSLAAATELRSLCERAFARGLQEFRARFAGSALAKRTAADAAHICRLEWLKWGLPVLDNRDPVMERVLERADCRRSDDGQLRPFTCDAMWLQGAHRHAIVLGPGDLGENGAHTEREHIDLGQLADYAARISRLLSAFAAAEAA